MKIWGAIGVSVFLLSGQLQAQESIDRARTLQSAGNGRMAKQVLREAAESGSASVADAQRYAEFLDRHNDPAARSTYAKLLDRLTGGKQRAAVARRLVALDLLAGDRDSAEKHLAVYRETGADSLGTAALPTQTRKPKTASFASIPGPIRSFSRMAAISTNLAPAEVLPGLARNIITSGYRVGASYEGLEPTEYMKLLNRYLSQARELEKLTTQNGELRIEECDSSETGDLLRVLGYRMRGGCGSEVILETVNATRAFLTIDSGFPLAGLEQALRTNRPFVYDFSPTRVPVQYGEDYWVSEKERQRRGGFIDAFMSDPSMSRLYLAMAKMDTETTVALRKQADMETLRAYAHVFDFFGSLFEIRDGKAVVPGGDTAAQTWAKLVGVSPNKGGEFFLKLAAVDDGWLASYYDSLRRIEGPVKDYLTDTSRLERFYLAVRGEVTSPGPARPVFRSNTDLMLLTTGIRLEANGKPHLPGGLATWRQLYADSPHKAYDAKLKKTAPGWDDEDDVVEALFALCRKMVDNDPLKIYMTLSDVNRRRTTPIQPETADRLARSWRDYGDQYTLFSELSGLRDQTMLEYLKVIAEIDRIGDRMMRADTAGALQALTGLWQIGVRHGTIPEGNADETLNYILQEFDRERNRRELFDATRHGVEALLAGSGWSKGSSTQDHLLRMLAGSENTPDVETRQTLIDEMRRIIRAQKLIPLDDILDLANHLEELAGGEELNTALLNRISTRIEELRPYREGLSAVERNAISFGYYAERHLQAQRKLNLRKEIREAMASPEKLRNLRAEMASVLRDTLVGFNYVHYAPPGAQLLRTNPLFVRGHDFLGTSGSNETWKEADVYGTGWPSSAGGRLIGSLAGMPYALAQAEQNFLIPNSEQALIWTDLVPQMVITAKVPRWWNTSADLIHWTALHVRLGRSTVAEAVLSEKIRGVVIETVRNQASPARVERIELALEAGDPSGAMDLVTPSELLSIGQVMVTNGDGAPVFSDEIRRLAEASPETINFNAVAAAFGTPKPRLGHTYHLDLRIMRTFPTLMGHSSRIMAESWESNLVYYATLADELHMRPSRLNVMIPEWTRKTLETIFATHLEDWPAVLLSLRTVGDEVRAEAKQNEIAVERASLNR